MVVGIEKFREYFKDYSGSYIVIGGTACDIIIDAAQLIPRATRDIDIVLVIEALSREFVQQFWKFINDGEYAVKEINEAERQYYRFKNPKNKDFPYQLELFSRIPDVLDIKEGSRLTPVPVDDDLSSLSAILLNEDYYKFTLEHSTLDDEVHRANTEALICLKAKAFLDLRERKEKGEKIDDKNIKKHKNDVFRMALLLGEGDRFDLPGNIKKDMSSFTEVVKSNLPDKGLFKEMGVSNIDIEKLFTQLAQNF
jgi:hypothetical protein